jgi:hypothetical protein
MKATAGSIELRQAEFPPQSVPRLPRTPSCGRPSLPRDQIPGCRRMPVLQPAPGPAV